MLYVLEEAKAGAAAGASDDAAAMEVDSEASDQKDFPRYTQMLAPLLDTEYREEKNVSDADFKRLLLDLPYVTSDCIGALDALGRHTNQNKMSTGLQLMRELAEYRVSVREAALQTLLSYTHDRFTALRTLSIRMFANQPSMQNPPFRQLVDDYAVSSLRSSLNPQLPDAAGNVPAEAAPVAAASATGAATTTVSSNVPLLILPLAILCLQWCLIWVVGWCSSYLSAGR